MKIGIVCYPTFGGSGVVATELGIELSKKGHEIHFITYSQPVRLDALSSNLHYHEVNVPDYPLFKYEPYELALSSKLYDVISKYEIDVLHVHYAIPHAYVAYLVKKMLSEGKNLKIITVGSKGLDQIKREYEKYIVKKFSFKDKKQITFKEAEIIGNEIINLFNKNEFDKCILFYNNFKNVITQIPQAQQIIPTEQSISDVEDRSNSSYEFEPEEDEILEDLLPKNLKLYFANSLIESFKTINKYSSKQTSVYFGGSLYFIGEVLKLNQSKAQIYQ